MFMSIALGAAPWECIVRPELNHGLNLIVKANAVNYKKVESLQTQTERQMKVEHENSEQRAQDSKKVVKIYPKLEAHCEKFIETMPEMNSCKMSIFVAWAAQKNALK